MVEDPFWRIRRNRESWIRNGLSSRRQSGVDSCPLIPLGEIACHGVVLLLSHGGSSLHYLRGALAAWPSACLSAASERKDPDCRASTWQRVHESGVPFDDASGNRLREWLGVAREVFYDPEQIAILPMGFCFPGSGRSGDLPPRPECAPA